MNDEIFFERYNKLYPPLNAEKYITDNNKSLYFTDNGFLIENEHNPKGDIVKISVSGKRSDNINEFIVFIKSLLKVYSPEVEFDDTEFLKKENGFYSAESEWYSYLSVVEDDYLFFSVNNKRLNPETPPELTLKSDDNSNKKTH